MKHCYLLVTCYKTSFVVDYCLESMINVGIPSEDLYVSSDYDRDFGDAETIVVSGGGFIEDCKEAITRLSRKYDYVILILDDLYFSQKLIM